MAGQKVGIIAECVCDLPDTYLNDHNVYVLYFVIETDRGLFNDTDEISSQNVIEYMGVGGRTLFSSPPDPEIYKSIYEKVLEKYDDVILVGISSEASRSNKMAHSALDLLDEKTRNRVHIFDSMQLSTGIGHLVIRAVEMAESGKNADEILKNLEEMRSRISTSFITVNADYLSQGGNISTSVKKFIDILGAHPVMYMNNGKITIKKLFFGDYEKASMKYIRYQLKKAKHIDKTRIFITHVGCNVKKIEQIREKLSKYCDCENIIVTKASATISCNCGSGTFGILYVNE